MATPEGQYIINGLKNLINQAVGIRADLTRIESKIPSEDRIVSRIIDAIQSNIKELISIIKAAISEGFTTIRASIDALKDIVLQLIKSLFGDSNSSIDYNRITQIVNTAHQTTREIIVNGIYSKIEAGFLNLEKLIKSLKLGVDYDRISRLIENAHNKTRIEIRAAIAVSQAALALAIAALIPAFKSAVNTLATAIRTAITELGKIIAEAIIKVLRELLKNPSIDYDRIAKIVNSAHQTTREIIVNQLYAKLEAGFLNLEKLIKSLKLSIDYDRIAKIVNSAHQTTREIIVNQLYAKLEAGFLNLERLIKSLRLGVDYNRIAQIVNSAHEITQDIIIEHLWYRVNSGFYNLAELIKSLFKSLKPNIDYNRIAQIVNSAHEITQDIIIEQLWYRINSGFYNLAELIKSLFKSLKPNIDYNRINQIVSNAIKQATTQIENTIKKLLQSKEEITWTDVSVPTVSCNLGDDGKYTVSKSNQTIKVLSTKTGNEAAKVFHEFQELAKTNEQLCLNRNNEDTAIAAVPEWWQIRPEARRPQVIMQFGELMSDGKIGSAKYPITIPHPIADSRWIQSPIYSYIKGDTEAILTLNDNSKLIVNCVNKNECLRVIEALKLYIQPDYLDGATLKVGDRNGTPIVVKEMRPKIAKYFSLGLQKLNPDWIAYF